MIPAQVTYDCLLPSFSHLPLSDSFPLHCINAARSLETGVKPLVHPHLLYRLAQQYTLLWAFLLQDFNLLIMFVVLWDYICTSQYLWKFHSLLFTKPGSLLLPPPLFSKPVAPPPLPPPTHLVQQHKTP